MRKILMGSIILIVFSISAVVFQISCQSETNAQDGSNYVLPIASTNRLGGVIVGSGLNVTNSGVLSVSPGSNTNQLNKIIFKKTGGSSPEIWMCNYDGTGLAKVNITLPLGTSYADNMRPVLSPDGQKIFFAACPTGSFTGDALYSCNSDGTNVNKIVNNVSNGTIVMGGAY